MDIEITFYFFELEENKVSCTSILNSDIRGIGSNAEEAELDYFEKFNSVSEKLIEEVDEVFQHNNKEYSLKKYILTLK
jgi:hypothetical protein